MLNDKKPAHIGPVSLLAHQEIAPLGGCVCFREKEKATKFNLLDQRRHSHITYFHKRAQGAFVLFERQKNGNSPG
jgi:hypothetical protein